MLDSHKKAPFVENKDRNRKGAVQLWLPDVHASRRKGDIAELETLCVDSHLGHLLHVDFISCLVAEEDARGRGEKGEGGRRK